MDLRSALEMGSELLDAHGLDEWQLDLDRARRRAGSCQHARRTITISAPITRLHSEAEVRETLLHEIAHALAGPRAGHGERWRKIALSIGSTGERCVPADAPSVPGAWVGTCPDGHAVQRHRRPSRPASCSICGSGFDLARLLEWTHHGRPAPMTETYEAELATLREGGMVTRVAVGSQVRIVVGGRWQGAVGRIVKHGRTRYHVAVDEGVLTVPFVGVEKL